MNGGEFRNIGDQFEYAGDAESFKEDLLAGHISRVAGRQSEDTLIRDENGNVVNTPQSAVVKRAAKAAAKKQSKPPAKKPIHRRMTTAPVARAEKAKMEVEFAKKLEERDRKAAAQASEQSVEQAK